VVTDSHQTHLTLSVEVRDDGAQVGAHRPPPAREASTGKRQHDQPQRHEPLQTTTDGASRARTDDLLHAMHPGRTLGEARNPSVYGAFRASRPLTPRARLSAACGRYAAITADK